MVARGVDRRVIFRDDRDRQRYLDLLREVIERYGWRVLAYCLMDNHVHLLVETPEPNLAEGMQWLNGHYGRYYNDRHDRCGHLFQGRYKALRQRTDAQLLQTLRYIVLNPVEAGICELPGEYRWSSHRAMAQQTDAIVGADRVFWFLDADDSRDGLRRYAKLIGDEWSMGAAGFEPATSRV